MNCKKFAKILPDYLDNELSVNQITEVKNHLSSCAACYKLYQNLSNTIKLLEHKVDIDEQPFYFTRLKQKMENEVAVQESFITRISLRKLVQPMLYLSSLIIAVYIGILIGSSGSTTQNQYSELNNSSTDYIETIAKSNYLNDYEREPIENFFLSDSSANQE